MPIIRGLASMEHATNVARQGIARATVARQVLQARGNSMELATHAESLGTALATAQLGVAGGSRASGVTLPCRILSRRDAPPHQTTEFSSSLKSAQETKGAEGADVGFESYARKALLLNGSKSALIGTFASAEHLGFGLGKS